MSASDSKETTKPITPVHLLESVHTALRQAVFMEETRERGTDAPGRFGGWSAQSGGGPPHSGTLREVVQANAQVRLPYLLPTVHSMWRIVPSSTRSIEASLALKDELERLSPGALHLVDAFERFEQDSEGVTAIFANGVTVRGAALIGCDGIRSNVRAQMLGTEAPRFTGRVAYRFLVPMDKAGPYMNFSGSASYIAPRKSLLRYTIRHGTLVNCVAFILSDSWMGEGWSERVTAEERMSLFEGWHPDVQGLARSAPLEGTAKWGPYDRDPLPVWTEGRVTLLGDAAHPMLPFLGLGAAMAIEDAVVLARACQALPDISDALRPYEKARSGRAGEILLASRHQAEIFSDGPDGARRPQMSKKQRMDYDPSTVAI